MNAPLNREHLKQLLTECKAPCISLYQPTHRSIPARQQDPIRFKNLLRQLNERVQQQTPEQADELLHPLQALLDEPGFSASTATRSACSKATARRSTKCHSPRRYPAPWNRRSAAS